MNDIRAQLPQLSTSSSFIISALITGSYFGGIYLHRAGRLSFGKVDGAKEPQSRGRDESAVIKARLTGVTLSSMLSCGLLYTFVARNTDGVSSPWRAAIMPTTQLLGLTLSRKIFYPCLLVPIAYTGPLIARCLSHSLPFQRNWSFRRNFLSMFTSWIGLRNYVVAPLTEEIVFRACLLAVARLSGKGYYHQLFITPLWFGAAHLHHAYELYNVLGRTPKALRRALTIVLVQLTYTTLFGAYASFLHVRTGSIVPSIVAHIFANIMGLPDPLSEVRDHPRQKLLLWAAYLGGLVAFAVKSGPWTAHN